MGQLVEKSVRMAHKWLATGSVRNLCGEGLFTMHAVAESKEFNHVDKSRVVPLAVGASAQALGPFSPGVVRGSGFVSFSAIVA